MAASVLFIVALFFSVRGFFLGFTGVIARLLGVMLGYFTAYSYRGPLTEFIIQQTTITIPPMLLQVAASAGLFFTTLFVTGLVVKGAFAVIVKLIPISKELFDGKSPGSRVFGAGCNGLIGAGIVLIALWGYNLLIDNPKPADTLQQVANRFGDAMLALATTVAGNDRAISNTETATEPSGHANVLSESDNSRGVSIEGIRQLIRHSTSANSDDSSYNNNTAIDLKQWLENDKIQDLLNHSAMKDMALKQLRDNPEQILDALNNPEYREILEQLESK